MADYTVYKATYSGTPVYEFIAKGIACMRRRSDSWINATQILKVADFDKPQRTRILEREVQRGTHEKVQGGYGKYQGTWVPLDRARQIAQQYNVEDILMPIFNFRPSTESPPLAPKHITAASSKPRPAPRAPKAPRAPAAKRVAKPAPPPPPPVALPPPQLDEDSFDEGHDGDDMSEIDPLDDPSVHSLMSSSPTGASDFEMPEHRSLKRKRGHMQHSSLASYEVMSPPHHRSISYSDELLDYFMNKDLDVPDFLLRTPPDFDVNEVIDTEGHTAIHWAAAMGDLKVIDLLVKSDANICARNKRGETPLMRAVLFTNNYDRRSFPRLVETLRATIFFDDKFGSTVFHHIAATTSSRNKLLAARYYNEVLLQKLSELHSMDEIAQFLDLKDFNGDTALTISARNVAKKCVRTLLGYNASPDIPNNVGETADRLIIATEEQRKHAILSGDFSHPLRDGSSSPYQPRHHDPHNPNPHHSNTTPSSTNPATQAAISYAASSHLPQPHTSEAAISATKKVIPLMAEMLEGLATAYDKELADKDEDHHQAQRLLDSSTEEIDQCRQAAKDTIAPFGSEMEMESQMEKLRNEAELLARELQETLERAQRYEICMLVREAEREVLGQQPTSNVIQDPLFPTPNLTPPASTNMADPEMTLAQKAEDDELLQKLQYAWEIAERQRKRKELIETIVEACKKSGSGGKMADYRRLIALSCGLMADDVEKLLPEILRDLEQEGEASLGC
ncbi:apses-domain-containing protein [Ascodesmis nigricans]|uniref:Apses-domain-containing protein n=1 Tax=Ascodesmis nigricans TaxID=341454 RepID=A0A4S2MXX8_9PEZI|nr:apses-domain-containing protein [Ascodesmis nigricans]